MTSTNPTKSVEVFSIRGTMADDRLDLPSIIRQIRLCRSALGAILEELECGNPNPGTVEQVTECTTSVTAEIEHLWETIKKDN
jgi:hypothetical protein